MEKASWIAFSEGLHGLLGADFTALMLADFGLNARGAEGGILRGGGTLRGGGAFAVIFGTYGVAAAVDDGCGVLLLLLINVFTLLLIGAVAIRLWLAF